MMTEPNPPHAPNPEPLPADDFDSGTGENHLTPEALAAQESLAKIASLQSPQNRDALQQARSQIKQYTISQFTVKPRALLFTVVAIAITFFGLVINNGIIGILGTVITLILSLTMLLPWWQYVLQKWFSSQDRTLFVAFVGLVVGIIGLFKFTGLGDLLLNWGKQISWEASGSLAEWFGALGQILIAIIAVYVAWRQYVISKDLTIQQNLLTVQQNIITQQQTIDSYFQGVSDLVLDEEGLLEDWPQERAIAEGRTAAIFSSVDGSGKAKIIRFLSRSKLLTPLKRDSRLGRAILDGMGGYAEDRLEGVRV
ncbi:pentapeptide repeat-containing protein, partial [Nodularia sphaerocarpa]